MSYTVEIVIDTEHPVTGSAEHVRIAARGSLAGSLRSCILRAGDRFAHDAAVQRLVDAVTKAAEA